MVRDFWHSDSGATMVETTIVVLLLFLLLFGFVDFGLAYYQWNAANKAVQVGARLAAVSNPVAIGLKTAADTTDSSLIGEAMAAGSYSFSCTGDGTCNSGAFDQAAFDRIFKGDDGACDSAVGRPGMCDIYPDLEGQEANVKIEYLSTGLGYWTRPGGPVPTIRISLNNVPFNFFFLNSLLGFGQITMPSMTSTITGEDLKSTF